MNFKERAGRLKTELPAVFLAMKDPRTPLAAKVFAGLAVAYALSPIDLIPDFIPVLGFLDDLLILPALLALAVRRIPPAVMEDCRARAGDMWKDGRPKRWYYALPIILLWLLLLALAVKAVWF